MTMNQNLKSKLGYWSPKAVAILTATNTATINITYERIFRQVLFFYVVGKCLDSFEPQLPYIRVEVIPCRTNFMIDRIYFQKTICVLF